MREEIKQNKSQNSGTKSLSKDKYRRNTSQDLKNKYLLRLKSQNKSIADSDSSGKDVNESFHQRSYSNSHLNTLRFQTPRGS